MEFGRQLRDKISRYIPEDIAVANNIDVYKLEAEIYSIILKVEKSATREFSNMYRRQSIRLREKDNEITKLEAQVETLLNVKELLNNK
jgi:hypothetical protein